MLVKWPTVYVSKVNQGNCEDLGYTDLLVAMAPYQGHITKILTSSPGPHETHYIRVSNLTMLYDKHTNTFKEKI